MQTSYEWADEWLNRKTCVCEYDLRISLVLYSVESTASPVTFVPSFEYCLI